MRLKIAILGSSFLAGILKKVSDKVTMPDPSSSVTHNGGILVGCTRSPLLNVVKVVIFAGAIAEVRGRDTMYKRTRQYVKIQTA
jgi:hypothetical protein